MRRFSNPWLVFGFGILCYLSSIFSVPALLQLYQDHQSNADHYTQSFPLLGYMSHEHNHYHDAEKAEHTHKHVHFFSTVSNSILEMDSSIRLPFHQIVTAILLMSLSVLFHLHFSSIFRPPKLA